MLAFDPRTAAEATLAATHAVLSASERREDPEVPPMPLAELVATSRHERSFVRDPCLLVVDSEEPIALVRLHLNDYRPEIAGLEVHLRSLDRVDLVVGPLREAARAAQEAGCRSVIASVPRGSPVEARLAGLGFTLGMVERISRLRTADLDRELLESWVTRAAERAREYSLVGWDGACPDEWLDRFVPLRMVMNTAPTEDLDWPEETSTVDRLRASEESLAAIGHRFWILAARHDPTDALVGYTQVGLNGHRPALAEQGDTAVDPAHRDRGLGRWLKAVMALRLLDEAPEVEIIDTGNAESNAPMLGINVAMGFRPHARHGAWQAPVAILATGAPTG
ncbi:hypothetical protein BH24ACT3_BH24ACT3_15810 [soil metagenome]